MIDWELYRKMTELVLHHSYENVKDTLDVFIHDQLEATVECPFCQKTTPYLNWDNVMHIKTREEKREDGTYQIREVVMYAICPLCKKEKEDHVVGRASEELIKQPRNFA